MASHALHQEVEDLVLQARLAAARGDYAGGVALRGRAARLEAEAFGLIPTARTATRRALATSATSLYLRGACFDEAIKATEQFLAEPDIAADAGVAAELRSMARDAQDLETLSGLVDRGRLDEARVMAGQIGARFGPQDELARLARHLVGESF